jgi:hypothetical protein
MVQHLAGRIDRHYGLRSICRNLSLGLLANVTPAKKVDTPVMRNTEEPRPKRSGIIKLIQFPVGFEERFLNDILTVHYGSSHA